MKERRKRGEVGREAREREREKEGKVYDIISSSRSYVETNFCIAPNVLSLLLWPYLQFHYQTTLQLLV